MNYPGVAALAQEVTGVKGQRMDWETRWLIWLNFSNTV